MIKMFKMMKMIRIFKIIIKVKGYTDDQDGLNTQDNQGQPKLTKINQNNQRSTNIYQEEPI